MARLTSSAHFNPNKVVKRLVCLLLVLLAVDLVLISRPGQAQCGGAVPCDSTPGYTVHSCAPTLGGFPSRMVAGERVTFTVTINGGADCFNPQGVGNNYPWPALVSSYFDPGTATLDGAPVPLTDFVQGYNYIIYPLDSGLRIPRAAPLRGFFIKSPGTHTVSWVPSATAQDCQRHQTNSSGQAESAGPWLSVVGNRKAPNGVWGFVWALAEPFEIDVRETAAVNLTLTAEAPRPERVYPGETVTVKLKAEATEVVPELKAECLIREDLVTVDKKSVKNGSIQRGKITWTLRNVSVANLQFTVKVKPLNAIGPDVTKIPFIGLASILDDETGIQRELELIRTPPQLASFILPSQAKGGKLLTGTLALDTAIHPTAKVEISSNNPAVLTKPGTVPKNKLSGKVKLKTRKVTQPTSVVVTASLGSVQLTQTVTLLP